MPFRGVDDHGDPPFPALRSFPVRLTVTLGAPPGIRASSALMTVVCLWRPWAVVLYLVCWSWGCVTAFPCSPTGLRGIKLI